MSFISCLLYVLAERFGLYVEDYDVANHRKGEREDEEGVYGFRLKHLERCARARGGVEEDVGGEEVESGEGDLAVAEGGILEDAFVDEDLRYLGKLEGITGDEWIGCLRWQL